MTQQDTNLTQRRREDGAVLESREPLSREPSGRSHRDGLSAAPSPVRWLPRISVENAARVFLVFYIGCFVGAWVFVVLVALKISR